MPSQKDNLIKNINTQLEQLSSHITRYNGVPQSVLKDFCAVCKPKKDRNAFKKSLKQFDTKYRFTERYFELAFLWFACDFVELIYLQLSLKKEILGFIHKTLRAVYSLVKEQVSLDNNSEWEELQRINLQKRDQILHEHYGNTKEIFFRLNSLIEDYNLGTFNPSHIYDAVRPSIHGPPWTLTIDDQISIFFKLTNFIWDFHFYPPAFLLSRVFVNLQIKKPGKFKVIQKQVLKPDGLVARASRAYLALKGLQKSFIGWIVIPKGSFSSFRNFLEISEENEIIKIIECQELVDFKYSVSYMFYQEKIGWSFKTGPFTEIANRSHLLDNLEIPVSREKENILMTTKWNKNWTCTSSRKMPMLIKTLCKYWRGFRYEDLCEQVGDLRRDQDRTRLFEPENPILRDLIKKQVLQIMITPRGLLRGYSPYSFILYPSRDVSKDQLKNFLSILPHGFSFELKSGQIRIFCYLDPFLFEFISTKLKWPILPLIQSLTTPILKTSYFDFEIQTWKQSWNLKGQQLGRLHF